jgi:hypothetical protein
MRKKNEADDIAKEKKEEIFAGRGGWRKPALLITAPPRRFSRRAWEIPPRFFQVSQADFRIEVLLSNGEIFEFFHFRFAKT